MPSSQFEFFGFAHIAAMGVILAVPIFVTLLVKWLDSAAGDSGDLLWVCGRARV